MRMSNKIFVGNLPFTMDSFELEELFKSFGKIQEANVVKDRESGKSRGFAFVTFSSGSEAQQALSMDGKEIQGRAIRVSEAQAKSTNR